MATKMMQTSAMKACFQIAECSKSSAKVIRIFDFSAFLVNLNAPFALFVFSLPFSAFRRKIRQESIGG